MKKYKLIIGLLLGLTAGSQAQNPAPAKPQTKPVVLTGATIHIGNGEVIQNGAIAFDKGIITQVGPAASLTSPAGRRNSGREGETYFSRPDFTEYDRRVTGNRVGKGYA